MTNRYHNLSIAELYSRLDDFLSDDEIAVREASRVVQAMFAKGERPDLAKYGALKYWKHICDEALHPRAAICFNAHKAIIAMLINLDKDMQEAIANGRSIDVAVIEKNGTVEHKCLRIMQIPAKTVAIMVENKKILPVKEQERILLANYKPRAVPSFVPAVVKANTGANTVSIGSHEVEPIKLIEALRELGFTVTK